MFINHIHFSLCMFSMTMSFSTNIFQKRDRRTKPKHCHIHVLLLTQINMLRQKKRSDSYCWSCDEQRQQGGAQNRKRGKKRGNLQRWKTAPRQKQRPLLFTPCTFRQSKYITTHTHTQNLLKTSHIYKHMNYFVLLFGGNLCHQVLCFSPGWKTKLWSQIRTWTLFHVPQQIQSPLNCPVWV